MFLLYWNDGVLSPGGCGEAVGSEESIRQVYLHLRDNHAKFFALVAPGGKACFPGEPRWWRGPYINRLMAAATPINGVTHYQPGE